MIDGLPLARLERDFFRTLNAFMEPAVRAGWAAPRRGASGLIVVETTGHRTKRRHRVPLVATPLPGFVLVRTVRGRRSAWVRNLAAHPRVRYWLNGKARDGTAILFAPGRKRPDASALPPLMRCAAESFFPIASLFGWAFAIIVPDGAPQRLLPAPAHSA